jgi:hypothetical protein
LSIGCHYHSDVSSVPSCPASVPGIHVFIGGD